MAENNNNPHPEQTPPVVDEDRNEFLKIDQQEIIPFDEKEEAKIKEQPETDYRSPEFIEYFAKKQVNKKNYQSMVNNIVKMCQLSVKEQIQAGHAYISPESKDLDKLKAGSSKREEEEKELSKSRHAELSPSPAEHKQFIERMSKARKVSEQKRKLKIQYEQSKKQALLKKEEEIRRQKQQKVRLEKQKQIKQKLEQKNKIKEKEKQQRNEAIKRYKSVISQKRRHELMAQKYEQNILQPMMEQRSKILQARSKRLKGYSIDEIRNYEIEYSRKEEERANMSAKSKQQWSYTPPPIHPRLYQILQEQKIRERIKLEEKKRALEEKIARQQYYAQYLKQSITVKVDEKKKLELEKLNAKKTSKTKSKSQRWQLGNNYLNQARSRIKVQVKDKKDNYSMQEQSHTQPLTSQKLKSNTSMGNHHDYEKKINHVHEQRINRLLSSNTIEKNQKLSQLKLQVDKLNERAKWREEVDKLKPGQKDNDGELEVLLSSIKAKIGIMSLYRH